MKPFVAVDFGNTQVKFGLFTTTDECFPLPRSVWNDFALLESRLPTEPLDWLFARTGGTQYEPLRNWINTHRNEDRIEDLTWQNIPMRLEVDFPENLGIDRLLAAFAAHSRQSMPENRGVSDSPLLVVDAGSAMTVDVVTVNGVFRGGAILPGWTATAKAAAGISPRLSEVRVAGPSFAAYPGRNTEAALSAGIYWGAVGAVRQFYGMVGASTIVLTGGNGNSLKWGLAQSVPENLLVEIPELVLVGAALCQKTR